MNSNGSVTTLEPNKFHVVQFPQSGPGFDRYTDANGANNGDNENYIVDGVTHHTDGWASPEAAVSFYNTVQDFHTENPNITIHYGDISAYDPSIDLGYKTYFTGNSIDIHYFSATGTELRRDAAYASGGVTQVNSFFSHAQTNGFSLNYSYGSIYTHVGNNNHSVHKDHFHIGR